MKNITKSILCFISTLILFSFCNNEKIKGEKVLQKMYKRYAGKWYKNFTFSQTTENFKNDSLIKTGIWHEAIVYPNLFRITMGDAKDRNAMIIVNDSVYNYSKGKMYRKAFNDDDLTFLLGGMYFYPFNKVKEKMKIEGYDITKACETNYIGKQIYIIGADSINEKTNQVWIEKDRLIVLRFIKYKTEYKEDAIFSDYKKVENGWRENSVVFYLNDKLYQKEKYFDCKANTIIDNEIFDSYDLKN